MANRTCSIEGCDRRHDARGLCRTHYTRWRLGKPLERPCVTCGRDVVTVSGRTYCSESCRPVCEVRWCDRPVKARGRCVRCYTDLLHEGRTGKTRSYRWADERRCVVCGATEWPGRGRKVCSGACKQLLARNGGQPPPKITDCVRCGSIIDLTVIGKGGRKKRADTKMCDWCKARRHARHKVSVMDIVNLRGIEPCAICSESVDLDLRHPSLLRASIDHIVPYSRGGTHDLSNLQVVHLYCNYVKSDREGFTL